MNTKYHNHPPEKAKGLRIGESGEDWFGPSAVALLLANKPVENAGETFYFSARLRLVICS